MTVAVRRARPWLGTLVEMRVEGLSEVDAARAIDAAFGEVAAVHHLMSFHEADSDISRIHAAVPGEEVAVDARTCEVLQIANNVSLLSQGRFDVTVAARLVERGMLPRPRSPYAPDPQASWRDIELSDADFIAVPRVRLRRPLWLDLGGIAKGYAVDRAIALLRQAGAAQAVVNAGGDLRSFGARAEPVALRLTRDHTRVPLVALTDAAVATSASMPDGIAHKPGPHVHGLTHAWVRGMVSVVAAQCVIADALTKVVLAGDISIARDTLAAFAAQACVHGLGCALQRADRAACDPLA